MMLCPGSALSVYWNEENQACVADAWLSTRTCTRKNLKKTSRSVG